MDKNKKKFIMPIEIEQDNQYLSELEKELKLFEEYISDEYKNDKELQTYISNVNSNIINAIKEYFNGNLHLSRKIILDLLIEHKDNPFIISELDKSYAFRGIAPYEELHLPDRDYSKMMSTELSFFRARKSTDILCKHTDMSYIPLDKRELTSIERFSIPGIPCLYLGTTSYCCWLELKCPPKSEFYCSSIKFNNDGKRIKVLNLAISQGLINGLSSDPQYNDFNISLIKIFPILMATSFKITQKDRKFKSEYIISQLIMQCLSELGIEGIAYISKQSSSDYEYPHNVNLAIPIIGDDEKIESLNKMFEICTPCSLEWFSMIDHNDNMFSKKSYINQIYEDEYHGKIALKKDVIFYSQTLFSKFDDYLVNQRHKNCSYPNEKQISNFHPLSNHSLLK